MPKTLSNLEIKRLCVANEVIDKAYKAFRKTHPYAKIVEMWEMAHFSSNIEEAYITYVVGGWQVVTYKYMTKGGANV